MHEHDFDLMAAYAEGSTSPEEAAAAERAISACGECSAEHAAQRDVLALLHSIPAVSMTDMERASLHRAVKQAAPASRVGWFARYAPRVAAVAAGFAIVGLASVTMLNGGEDATERAALDRAAVNDTDEAAGDDGAEAPALGAPVEEAQSTAGAALDDAEFAAEIGEDTGAVDPAAEVPLLEITATDLESLAKRAAPPETAARYEGLSEETNARCPGLPDPLQWAVEVLFEEQPAILVLYSADGETVVAVLSVEDCTILTEFATTP